MDTRIRHLSGHVVVGVDGSRAATAAVRHAAAEAARRHTQLQVLHAADPALYEYQSGPAAYAGAHHVVDSAAREALHVAPQLDVERSVVRATPVGALLDASHDAGLVVVGSRGLGALAGLVLGSVGLALAGHAHCPTLVVPEDAGPAEPKDRAGRSGGIVVAVSDTCSRPAVELAAHEAALHGMALHAVHAWTMPLMPRSAGFAADGGDVTKARASVRARLAEVVAEVADLEPGVRVEQRVVRDSAARTLIRASRHANLLVLAARQRPPGLGTHVGAVTRAVLRHGHCPVLLVPVAQTAHVAGPNAPDGLSATR